MIHLVRGAKAGALSGVIYGAVQSPLINFGGWVYGSIRAQQRNLPVQSFGDWVAGIMQPWFLGTIILGIIIGVVSGLIFGLIFVALYDKLPGKTPAMKGIVTSLIYMAAIPLGLPVLISLTRWGFEDLMAGFYWFFLSPFNWLPIAIGLGTSILWGWLLGHFWASKRLGKL
jgi:hypothetical protein